MWTVTFPDESTFTVDGPDATATPDDNSTAADVHARWAVQRLTDRWPVFHEHRRWNPADIPAYLHAITVRHPGAVVDPPLPTFTADPDKVY